MTKGISYFIEMKKGKNGNITGRKENAEILQSYFKCRLILIFRLIEILRGKSTNNKLKCEFK